MASRNVSLFGHLLFYFAALFGGAGLTFYFVNQSLFSPVDPNAGGTSFIVEKGWGLKVIAQKLEDQNLVSNSLALELLGKLYKSDDGSTSGITIFPGEYALSAAMTPKEILEAFKNKKVVYHTVAIPEGFTLSEIALVMAQTNLCSVDEAKAALRDKSLLAKFQVPTDNLEGYPFPETYKFTRPDGATEMVSRMLTEGAKQKSAEFLNRASELGYSYHQILTLASVIEKETGAEEERPVISSVFHNRLRIGMPLQSDPTVIYGIPNFDGNLTKQHLKTPTLYNTYINPGLPPTPIASPGLESIKAALYPADTEYLYFVAKGDGTHAFSQTYKEHRKYVNQYQRGMHQLRVEKPKEETKEQADLKKKLAAEAAKKTKKKAPKKRKRSKRTKNKKKSDKPISQLDFE